MEDWRRTIEIYRTKYKIYEICVRQHDGVQYFYTQLNHNENSEHETIIKEGFSAQGNTATRRIFCNTLFHSVTIYWILSGRGRTAPAGNKELKAFMAWDGRPPKPLNHFGFLLEALLVSGRGAQEGLPVWSPKAFTQPFLSLIHFYSVFSGVFPRVNQVGMFISERSHEYFVSRQWLPIRRKCYTSPSAMVSE